MLMTAADAPLALAGGAPTIADLVGLPMIGFRHCMSGERTDEFLRARGLDMRVVFRSDDNGTVQGLVGAGMASALVPLLAADPTDERVRVMAMDEEIPARRIAIAWHRDRALSTAARAFIDLTADLCAEIQPTLDPVAARP